MIKHIAIVMDGNRRWAKANGFLPMHGHSEGVNSLKKVIEFCLKKDIRYASLYTFSIENFKRPEQEKLFLFDLLLKEADGVLKDLSKQKVRVRFVGDRSLFPEKIKRCCDRIEKNTEMFDRLTVNLLFCYGARQEIVASTKKIANLVKSGKLREDEISEEVVTKNMWTGAIPDPEIVVRTGGAKRLSNFLLYQSAYSELYFLDCFWPEITIDNLESVYRDFTKRKRRFGV